MRRSAATVERPYRRLSPLTPLVRSFIFVVAVVSTSWRDLLRGDVGPFGWVLLGLLAAGAVYGTASWLRTKYWIEADELRVDTGVISRQSRRIRIDRLQGIDIVQPFVARLFGLAELKMDVAGGGSREGSLAFLPLKEARALKDLLLARREAVRAGAAGTSDAPEGEGPAEPSAPAAPAPERLLARVGLPMLLASLALSPETVSLVLGTAVLGTVFLVTGQWAGVSALLPVVGGFAVVLFRRLSANYGFRVSETPAGIQVRRGLFELSSQTIALPRVQGVVVTEPWMWRPLGWARLDVSIAGYAKSDGDNGPSASTVLPVAERPRVSALGRHLLDGREAAGVVLTAPPDQAKWVAPVRRHFMAAGLGEELVVSRSGWLTRRTHAVPHARVQSLRITQGPWQRLLGLADLHVDSPPGPVRVRARHRLAADARDLLERERAASRQARQSVG